MASTIKPYFESTSIFIGTNVWAQESYYYELMSRHVYTNTVSMIIAKHLHLVASIL